jgi:hypothetical protein
MTGPRIFGAVGDMPFLAIEAIRKDKTCGRQLEITVERMIEGAFRRRGPPGKLCRKGPMSQIGHSRC